MLTKAKEMQQKMSDIQKKIKSMEVTGVIWWRPGTSSLSGTMKLNQLL